MMAKISWILYVKTLFLSLISLASFCCTLSGSILKCRNCNFTLEPLNISDTTITELVLSDEDILKLPNDAINAPDSLQKLILTEGVSLSLEEGSFAGISSLQYIDSNIASFAGPLPSGIFQPLKNLTHLKMFYTYPNDMANNTLDNVPNLRYLGMRMAPHAVLGMEFSFMKNLQYLHIFRFHFGNMTRKTFAAIPNLETLHVAGGLMHIEPDALVNFHNLSTLALTCNRRLSIKQVSDAIKRQKEATLEKLVLDNSEGDGMFVLSGELFNSTKFDKITHLSLRGTYLSAIDQNILDVPQHVLSNLEYISLGSNTIIGIKGVNVQDVNDTLLYRALQGLNRRQIKTIDLSYSYNTLDPSLEPDFCLKLVDTFFRSPDVAFIVPTQNKKFNRTVVKLEGVAEAKIMVNIPPSLQYLFLDHASYHGNIYLSHYNDIFNEDNNIVFINCSHVKLKYNRLMKGLLKLQGLDVSFCQLEFLHPSQLHYLPSLKYLNLAHNNLAGTDVAKFFSGGDTLQWLDFSYNDLKEIPKYCLSNLTSAEYISFRGNPFVNININLENNTRLKTLDLSSGVLEKIDKDTIHQLEGLQAKLNHTLHLNVSGNTFQCTCETIEMIQWFSSSSIDIKDKERIDCNYKNKTTRILAVDVEKLKQECSKRGLSVYVSVTVASLIVLVIIALVYQFRWKLKWYIYRLRRYIRHKFQPINDELLLGRLTMQFHAFVAYNHTADYEWVADTLVPIVEDEWGLELCIAQRDFEAGKAIAENICEAIDRSNRTILLITSGFVKSGWCDFEMQMALTRNVKNLIIIYKEEVPTTDMSKTLVFLMKSLNYIEYNEDPNGLQMFWEKLHKSLTSFG